METTIQPFWMYFEMKNYHQSWCFQYIYLYKLRKLSFFTKFPEKTIFLTKKKTRRRTLIPALPHHQLVASMNWNITTGTNACQTHTHTKNFHILHMPTLAPSYSLSPFAGTRTQWVRFWLVWSPGLSPRPWTVSMLLLQPNSLDHWMCAGIDFTQQTSPICVWMFMYW